MDAEILNLPAENPAASPDWRVNMIAEGISLRTVSKKLRVKSEELRKRNCLLMRKAEATSWRCFELSNQLFEPTTLPEAE